MSVGLSDREDVKAFLRLVLSCQDLCWEAERAVGRLDEQSVPGILDKLIEKAGEAKIFLKEKGVA